MERKVQRRVGEEFCEDLQYYHRLCALTVVSTPFPIPLGIRFQKNGESEVACTLALLEDLIERLGRRFFDLLVADALYLQKPFVEAVEANFQCSVWGARGRIVFPKEKCCPRSLCLSPSSSPAAVDNQSPLNQALIPLRSPGLRNR